MKRQAFLKLSDAARVALQSMCNNCRFASPVVAIYWSSDVLPPDAYFDSLLASGASKQELRRAAKAHATASRSKMNIKLVVDCVPPGEIPADNVVEVDGIKINAPVPAESSQSSLVLDFRNNEFTLLADDGTNLTEALVATVKGRSSRLKS